MLLKCAARVKIVQLRSRDYAFAKRPRLPTQNDMPPLRFALPSPCSNVFARPDANQGTTTEVVTRNGISTVVITLEHGLHQTRSEIMAMHTTQLRKNILHRHEGNAEAFSRLRIKKSAFAQEAAKPRPLNKLVSNKLARKCYVCKSL